MKKITSLFAVLAMLATLFVMPVSAETGYAGGNGTEGNPYQIATKEQLAYANGEINAGRDNNAYFVLTADIDYEGQEWKPLGATDSAYFGGHFDGDGYVVKNLTITTSYPYVGFFGCLYNGAGRPSVKNLGIENIIINVTTGSRPYTVGAFASYVQTADVTNCYVKNSEVKCSLQMNNGIGVFSGLVRTNSAIENCYVYDVDVNSHSVDKIAGFAHQLLGGGSTFRNCYAAEITVLYQRTVYGFGQNNQSSITEKDCYSTLANSGSYNSAQAFGEYVADKDTLAGKFNGLTGWAVSEDVNDGYPCFTTEVPESVATPIPTVAPTVVPTVAPTPTPATGYAGGDGTEASPYQIATKEQLANANTQINSGVHNNAYFVLTADIDYEGQEWKPLGASDSAYFGGHFDGAGHVVKNLTITTKHPYVGFFGCLYKSGGRPSVKNLGIENIDINISSGDKPNTVSAFASYVQGADVTNCYIKNSEVKCSLQMNNGIGAFSGLVRSSSVMENCYVYDVEVSSHSVDTIAGFAHQLLEGGSTFKNCYAVKVESVYDRTVYGFGKNTQSNVTLESCYSTLNDAKGKNSETPAFDATRSMGVTGATAEAMTLAAVASGAFKESNGYPELDIAPDNGYAGGNGTKYNPYQIGKASQLAYANKQINAGVDNDKFFILTDDIDYNNGEWEPLGSSDAAAFSGGFDGNGHTVKNLSIYNESSETPYTYIGFFGLVDDAKITNLGIEGFKISAYNTGKVISAIGGFAGYVQGATTITNCFIKNSSVVQRWNFGPVSNGFGGFIGTARRTQGDSGDEVPQIKNCYVYNTMINGGVQKAIAGFVGSLYNNEAIALTNCYADIHVEVDTISVYGFGAQSTYGTYNQINNCYSTFAGQDGTSEYAGTYTPANSYGNVGASMQDIRTALAGTGFEMEADINDGYPYLAYEVKADDAGVVVPDFMVKAVKPAIGTESTDDVTVTVSKKSGVTDNAKVYVAGYDIDGRLLNAGSASITLDEFEFTADVSLSTAATVKVFVWNEDITPVANDYSAENKKDYGQLWETSTSSGVGRAPRLVLMGDSLMDDVLNPSDGVENKAGWQGYIANYLSEDIVLVPHGHCGQQINDFINGRSTYHTCSWETIKTEFGAGDYIILALGTNDANAIAAGEYTVTDFKNMYKQVIADARAKGATIILQTPPVANWHYNSSTGKFESGSVFETTRQAIISVGLETNTPVIDMAEALADAINAYIESSGMSGRDMCITTEDGKITKSGVIFVDTVHFTKFGADLLAKTVAEQVSYLSTGLEDYVK